MGFFVAATTVAARRRAGEDVLPPLPPPLQPLQPSDRVCVDLEKDVLEPGAADPKAREAEGGELRLERREERVQRAKSGRCAERLPRQQDLELKWRVGEEGLQEKRRDGVWEGVDGP